MPLQSSIFVNVKVYWITVKFHKKPSRLLE